ncbi:hypothetical protein [Methylobacterium sp. B1]|uniref:hypothetical protein n=1 Tax=Methylobacterium sp. B1 TaxID=91459 RepID=UPI00034C6D1B|nr:hypothetical protein [Methylobacterium sp. B1]
MLARGGSLALTLLLCALAFDAPAARAAGRTLVNFVSGKEMSFPLEPDALAVKAVRFPFLAANGTDPGALEAQVIVTSRDGNTSNLPVFTASILAPSGLERLHSLQITAADGNKVLPAGRYDITVLLWLNSVPQADPAGGNAPCADCQSETFKLTRDAAEIALDDPRLVVSFPSPVGPASATLRETGGRSGGQLSLQSVTAQLAGTGPTIPINAALAGATLAQSGIQTLRLPGAADLPIGTWTATVRIRSDQAATPELTKTITIVSKVAGWVLITAIALGILVGYLVRGELALRIRRAEANAEAADLAAQVRLLAGSIRDEKLRATCRTELENLEAAIGHETDPDRVKKLTESAAAAIAAGEAGYKAREQEERQKLTARLGAIRDLTTRVPGVGGSLATISDALTRRLALVDQTLVSNSEGEEKAYASAIAKGGKDIITWVSETKRSLSDLQNAWPRPPAVGETLKSVADLANELSLKDPSDPGEWLEVVVQASRLADRMTATLKNHWLPAIQNEIRSIAESPIDPVTGKALRAAEDKLVDMVSATRESAAVGPELRQATIEARKAAEVAEATEQAGAHPAAAATDAITQSSVPPGLPLPLAWEIAGPDTVTVGETGRWQLVQTRAATGDPCVTWRVDGRIVAHGALTLLRTFAKSGIATISAEIVNSGEAPVTLSVDVTLRPSVAGMSAAVWRARGEGLQHLQTAILGVLITFSGYFVLESDFASWKDAFAGFMWGFSADVTLQTLMAIKVGARPAPASSRGQ